MSSFPRPILVQLSPSVPGKESVRTPSGFLYSQTQKKMGTEWEITISALSEEATECRMKALGDGAFALLERLEDDLSEFRPKSWVSRLNAAPPEEWVSVPREVWSLLRMAHDWTRKSSGDFDCTFRSEGPGLPPTPLRLEWDEVGCRVRRTHAAVRIGLGAIGKGFAVDAVRDFLDREGIRNFRIVAGGSSLYFAGEAAPGQPWEWSWAWGKAPGERTEPMPVTVSRLAVGVSGTSEKGEHVVFSGPSESAVAKPRSVLVASAGDSARAAELDAASTALFARFSRIGADSEPPAWLDQAWKVAVRSVRLLPVLVFLLSAASPVANADAEEEVDLSVEAFAEGDGSGAESAKSFSRTPLYAPAARQGIWMLAPLLSLGLVALHLKRIPRAGVRRKKPALRSMTQEKPS